MTQPGFSEEIRKFPFVRLLFFLITGIIIQVYFPTQPAGLLVIVSVLIIGYVISLVFSKNFKNLRLQGFADFSAYALVLSLGSLLVSVSHEEYNSLLRKDLSGGFVVAEINGQPSLKEKTVKAELNVIAIKSQQGWEESQGNVMAYFEKDSASVVLKPGDRLLIDAAFSDIEGPKNPEEFNYKKYLAFHLIAKQSYINSGSWKIIDLDRQHKILNQSLNFRKKLTAIYERSGITGRELAVLSALTLGYRDQLDALTKKAYAASGAMHVLAVSGLHIGIIFLILTWILKIIPDEKYWKIIRISFILSALWSYAFITGMSPSVFRATLMFSFIAIGNYLERRVNVYNSLAASAFILLVINPFYIFEVGFQLSYLAVLGIVFFQPRIASLFQPENKLIRWGWELMSVSVAAQLSTTPVTIFYFHQFPNYFLLTNFLVIPLAFAIIYLAVLLFTFSFTPAIAGIIAKAINVVVKLLNDSVSFIEGLPFSLSGNLYINKYQVWILYVGLLIFATFLIYRKKSLLRFFIISLILFFSINLSREYKIQNQKYFMVYNIRNMAAYNFVSGIKNLLISDASATEAGINYHVRNHWIKLGLSQEKILYFEELQNTEIKDSIYVQFRNQDLYYRGGMVFIENRSILFPELLKSQQHLSSPMDIDYIVTSSINQELLEWIISNFRFKQLIFDAKVSIAELENYKDQMNQLNINYFAVAETGAFVLEIED